MFRQFIFDFFGYLVIFYTGGILLSYFTMIVLAGIKILGRNSTNDDVYKKEILFESPYLPGVSIVAPAFNEAKTIVDNVKSLLNQDYPLFEVVIVNDGSKDETLSKLINEFKMVQIPYDYVEKLHTQPFRAVYNSVLPEYAHLYVVDKENGGTKADAVNAGLNVARYSYFINTDVDCILSRDAIFQCILPVLRERDVIAVSGAMTMSNGCKVRSGELQNRRAPWRRVPLFQTMEYMRSFFVGKMAWSAVKGMPNVSGGYGLFKKDVMIAAGGYRSDSFAEDMEMLLDAEKYCVTAKIPYRVVQIPVTCCWTEAPHNLKILYRQRSRWGRGLIQTFSRHWDMVFNCKYGVVSAVTMPYIFFFEFLAPFIEVIGALMIIYLAFTGGVNWTAAILLMIAIYMFNIMLSNFVMAYDYIAGSTFDSSKEYVKLFVASLLEPFFFHPFVSVFSLVGYFKHISGARSSWGNMTRTGYAGKDSNAPSQGGTPNPEDTVENH